MATKLDKIEQGESVEIDAEDDSVKDTDDGGAIVRLDDAEDEKKHREHFANIVDEVDQSELKEAVNDLLEKIERDKEAREKRDKLYEEGLRRTGLGDDAPGGAQFSGATRVVHPLLVEACVDFSARVMRELFPSNGPVRSKVTGERNKDLMEKAQRKVDYMNWQLTEQMPEFRGELEQLTTQVPLGGAQYMKIVWDEDNRRPVAEFVPIDDILLPFAATNFYTAERKTHRQYLTKQEYQRRVKSGMYIDSDLSSPQEPEYSKASIANDKIEGRKASSYNEDGLRVIYEVNTRLDFGDGPQPYLLTIDKYTDTALSLYRNWEPEDKRCQELNWIVEFPFIPWRGAYPIGLTHLIGGLSGAATGALRALLDSAHIQNIPGMLKLKGGPNGQTISVNPTEVTEIEGGGIIDDIRKVIMPMPFNPPSQVLYQLLGFLIDAGKGVVQTSFEKLSDANANQPVGTTLALIEQGMVVFSSIHSRLHNSMSRVFKIIHRINSAYLTEEDLISQYGKDKEVEPSDFDGPIDIIPVSDPGIFSETQRFAQVQAIMQRAAVVPQLYDQRKIEEMFLRSLKVPDDLLNKAVGEEDMDPVSENMAATMGRPLYVLPKQDHITHMKLHMAFAQSPLFGQNPTIIRTFLYPMATHLRDHLLNYYYTQAHEGMHLGVQKGVIEAESDQQAKIVASIQQLIEQELQGFGQTLVQLDQQAQQFKPQAPIPPDSSMQVAQLNAQLAQQLASQRTQIDQAKLQQQSQSDQMQAQFDQQKLQYQTQHDQMQVQMGMAKEQMRQQSEDRRKQSELQTRERMNTADNDTAMRITASEIVTGEKSQLSTGTGINPNP
jgi:hypothetical protein